MATEQELLNQIETLVKENSSLHSSLQAMKESFTAHKETTNAFLTEIGGKEFNRAQYEETRSQIQLLTEKNLTLSDENVRLDGINRNQANLLIEVHNKLDRQLKTIDELQREMAVKEATYSTMIDQLKSRIGTLTDANKSTTDVSGDSPSSS